MLGRVWCHCSGVGVGVGLVLSLVSKLAPLLRPNTLKKILQVYSHSRVLFLQVHSASSKAKSVCSHLGKPSEADARVLSTLFPSASRPIKRNRSEAFDPLADCVVSAQKQKRRQCTQSHCSTSWGVQYCGLLQQTNGSEKGWQHKTAQFSMRHVFSPSEECYC